MNALMTIQVRVLSAKALAELKALEMQSKRTALGVRGMGTAAGWGLPLMARWGSQVQWMGRQLTYNFAIPIALAMGLATKFALDNEKAMVRVVKVYGDGSKAFNQLSKTEIPALQGAFEALSNEFGINQAAVIDIAGDWAAAGASGLALAKVVKLTLETMVLGELEATEATRDLIAIQAQYGMNTKQLAKTIDILNMVENQTGATMADLIAGMSRAAGVAKTAGIDVEHLSAMMAALVPATGTATTAGNGLRTMISRLLSPTEDAVDVMKEMGVEVRKEAWESLNGTQRLETMAAAYDRLSNVQKIHVASVVASRYQLNRFSTLMDALNNQNSYYYKSLKATSDRTAIYKQRVKELNTVLESNPQKIKQVWTIMQNAMADVIVPVLPLITYLAQELARLFHAFQNINPEVQKLIMAGLVFIVVLAVGTKLLGAFGTLIYILSVAVDFLFVSLVKTAAFLATPFVFALRLVANAIITVSLLMMNTLIWSVRQVVFGIAWAIGRFIAFGALIVSLGVFNAMLFLWETVLINMQFLWAATWSIMTAITSINVTKIIGLFRLIPVALAAIAPFIIAALTNPWTIAIAAALGIAYHFRDDIVRLWHDMIEGTKNLISGPIQAIGGWFVDLGNLIADVFWALPESVRNAMIAVLTVIRDAAMQIYEWMSYLNPFATHSPSLVDSVTAGMDEIARQYGRVKGLGGVFASAAADLAKFKKMIPAGNEFKDDRKDVAKSIPKALPLFDKLVGHLNELNKILRVQQRLVDAQQAVVDKWKQKLDQANAALDRQQDKLDRLQDKLAKLQAQYDSAQQKMQDFASAPIAGMQAMSDAIFDNEMAQKRLQLQMMQWEQANGSIDDMRDRLAGLEGDIEMLRGKASELRQGGAGSDILGPIEQQIAALEAQSAALRNTVNNNPVDEMAAQMERLQAEGQMLQLQYDIKYEPLTRSIQQLANAQKELSYDEIVAGIREQQAVMAQLQPQIDAQTAAVAAQTLVVEQFTAARDEIQKVYDQEQAKLDRLNESYQKTADLIGDIEEALRGMASAATSAGGAAEAAAKAKAAGGAGETSNAVKTFRAGKGMNFPEVGSQFAIGREGGLEDQSAQIEEFTQQTVDDMNKVFGGMDMFGPIKKQWHKVWGWIQENIGPVVSKIGEGIGKAFEGMGGAIKSTKNSGFIKSVGDIVDTVVDIFHTIGGVLKDAWELFGPDLKKIGKAFIKFFVDLWTEVAPEIEEFGGMFKDLAPAFEGFWKVIKPFVLAVGGILLFLGKIFTEVLSRTIGPVLDLIIAIIKNAIKIIRGVFEIIIGLLSGDWEMAWKGVKDVVGGTLGIVIASFVEFGKVLWGIAAGIVMGIVHFFEWLNDKLPGGTVKRIVEAILWTFEKLKDLGKWIWNNVLVPIADFFVDLWHFVVKWAGNWWTGMMILWENLKTIGIWLWVNVLMPIWQKLQDLWGFVSKWAGNWWTGMTIIWEQLKSLGQWLWDNVLSPVWNKLVDLWNFVSEWAANWWEGMKILWEDLKQLGQWLWDNVLSPIWEKVQDLWDFVKEWAGNWWTGIKIQWENIKKLGQWIWDNVLKPVWDKAQDLWNFVKEWAGNWWTGIKIQWENLKSLGQWIWDNVLNPVWGKAQDLWNFIVTWAGNWWQGIKNLWQDLKDAAGWIKDNVMDPVKKAFQDGWGAISDWFTNSKDTILAPIKSVVRGIVDAINFIIKGINKLDALPGVEISISELTLPEGFARGGIPRRRVGNGFMTHGARAIVGEGKANYPEFVIPTDPTHRRRATLLLQMAAGKLGVPGHQGMWGDNGSMDLAQVIRDNPKGDLPMYDIGGFLGDVAGAVGNQMLDLGEGALGLGANALKITLQPYIALAKKAADKIDWSTGRDAAYGAIDLTTSWLDGANKAYHDEYTTAVAASKRGRLQKGLDFARSQAGVRYQSDYGAVGPEYYDCSGFMSAITRAIRGQNPHDARLGATSSFPWPGFGPITDASNGFLIGSANPYPGSSVGHMAGTLLGVNVESAGGVGVRIGAGARGWTDGGFNEHAQLALQNGAIILAKKGGTLARLGEGGSDEAVVPLPNDWRRDAFGGSDGKGNRTINIYGDLEFPNVTSGDDVESFLENLESMAKD